MVQNKNCKNKGILSRCSGKKKSTKQHFSNVWTLQFSTVKQWKSIAQDNVTEGWRPEIKTNVMKNEKAHEGFLLLILIISHYLILRSHLTLAFEPPSLLPCICMTLRTLSLKAVIYWQYSSQRLNWCSCAPKQKQYQRTLPRFLSKSNSNQCSLLLFCSAK